MTDSGPQLAAERLLAMYRDMVLIRTFDERMVALQRQGRIGNYPPCWGEEATQVGPLHAASPDDWLFPTYRQQLLPILRGVDPATILRYRAGIGGRAGFWDPRAHRCAPITISIATHLPHAVGLAYAARIKEDPVCAIAWFGDGATSEGDFHEALNFAAVLRAGVVFFCTNNQWAISTPVTKQMATETVAEKAQAYGIPGERIDGFDVGTCFETTKRALERARAGEGPTLIEALTYRTGPHATADDPSRYRDPADVETWRAKEPIGRLQAQLRAEGVLDDSAEASIRAEARDRVARAVADLDATEKPPPDVLFETTYAGAEPWPVTAARDEIRRSAPH